VGGKVKPGTNRAIYCPNPSCDIFLIDVVACKDMIEIIEFFLVIA